MKKKVYTRSNPNSVFHLHRCGSKQGEDDYRPLFENFVHDLLSTINRPEWPAAELLLSLLGRLLVSAVIHTCSVEKIKKLLLMLYCVFDILIFSLSPFLLPGASVQ